MVMGSSIVMRLGYDSKDSYSDTEYARCLFNNFSEILEANSSLFF